MTESGKTNLQVSIVIPVYDVEKWLPACLDSVLAQTLENIEVICVDDCSPDGCAQILADYAVRDSRVQVITLEQNSGQGVARNAGFAQASGRYVYFLDSDDMIVPEALEELVARADADSLDGIFFDSEVIYDSPELEQRYQSYPAKHAGSYPIGPMKGLALFEAFVSQYDWTCYVQRQFWRAEYLRKNGITFPSYFPHEDEAFAVEALVRAERVAYIQKAYFIRRYRVGSAMTTKMGPKNFRSYFESLCHMIDISDELELDGNEMLSNQARIFFACKRLYEQLRREDVDPLELFDNDVRLRDRYLIFIASQNLCYHYGLMAPVVYEAISHFKHLYIYGAGIIASDVFDILAFKGFAIEGFLVSSMAGNPIAFKGHHVLEAANVPCDPDSLVLIAVTDGHRGEIERLLDDLGWNHIFFRQRQGD